MQKPRFKTSEKAAWVFIHTRLRPAASTPTMDRRTAQRCGYLLSASRLLNRPEKDLPLPRRGESVSSYLRRIAAEQSASR